jgi:hypothetical protein
VTDTRTGGGFERLVHLAGLSADIRRRATMTELAEASSSSTTDALVERLFTAVVDTVEVACVHVGGRLGFYRRALRARVA